MGRKISRAIASVAPPRKLSVTTVEQAFCRNYQIYQYSTVDFLAEHLADTSQAFEGDMQMAVLLAVIGQVHLSLAIAAEVGVKKIDEFPLERRGITTSRLADATAIPRETVRRKLLQMEKKGWLAREGNFWLLELEGYDAVARRHLAGIDSRTVKRVARLFSSLAQLLNPQELQGQSQQTSPEGTEK